jgi:hypothetical protein
MTVEQLVELLLKVDQKREVVISRDEEGNGYSPLWDVCDGGMYRDGEVGLEKLTQEDIEAGYTEADVFKTGAPAVVLYPR